MGKKFAMVVFGLLVLFASQGWAGTLGNGAAQRRAAAGLPPLPGPDAKTRYEFCYAGNPKVVYFTQVVTVAPGAPGLGDIAYSHYIQKRYALPSIDRMRCVPANSGTDAEVEKERYKGMLGRTLLVDNIKWDGN
jgi:hypothetical protein